MKCINCGIELPDGSNQCPNCGYMFSNNGPTQMGGQTVSNNINQGNAMGAVSNVGNQPKKKHGCLIAFLIVAGVSFLLLILLVSCVAMLGSSSSDSKSDINDKTTEVTTEDATEVSTEATTEVVTEAVSEEVTTEEVTTEAESKVEFDPSAYRDDISYDSLSRKPDDYIGMKIALSGDALNSSSNDDETYLYFTVADDAGDIAVAYASSDILDMRILNDDKITVYGEYKGIEEFTNSVGGVHYYPYFIADKVVIDSYDDTADSPTGELKTGTFSSSEVSGEITIERTAEITYQDGEAYAITLEARIANGPKLGSAWCFLTDNGNGTYTGDADGLCKITITTYSDHFNVTYSCDEEYLYNYDGIQGDYYY